MLRRYVRRDAEPRPAGERRGAVYESVRADRRVRAVAFDLDPGPLRPVRRLAPHALPGHAAGGDPLLPGIPPRAGYYCSNNIKTDYNFVYPKATWDDCSKQAHWRNRQQGQPFFSVFNIETTHESQIRLPEARYRDRTRNFTPEERHDPARAPIPPYHPDTPEVRQDWARFYDMITVMDKQVAALLKQLDDDGLTENTIVFWFPDHGTGMPRSKRWLYDSSTLVPVIARFPKKYQNLAPAAPGTALDRLVSFVDFGPSVLSLAGVPVPDAMQGQAFLGAGAGRLGNTSTASATAWTNAPT